MLYIQKKQTTYLEFEKLSVFPIIRHFVSTRLGGVSAKDALASLNLSFRVNDDEKNVIQNRQLLAEAVGIPLEHFCFPSQVHGEQVTYVRNTDKGRGVFEIQSCLPGTDALLTTEAGICLMVMSADCVPVLFYEPDAGVIAAVHAGWQGTVKRIAQKTAQQMVNEFGCKADRLLVGIGPSIGALFYEVGEEVCEAVIRAFGTDKGYLLYNQQTGRRHFDLWYANRQQLAEIGIPEKNIEVSGLCTFSRTDLFFSSRKGRGESGRFGAGIMLNG